jgi:hypothetical protein
LHRGGLILESAPSQTPLKKRASRRRRPTPPASTPPPHPPASCRARCRYTKAGAIPTASSADITIDFARVHLFGAVDVYDIWAGASLGSFTGSFTATGVAYHDTAFLRLTEQSQQ